MPDEQFAGEDVKATMAELIKLHSDSFRNLSLMHRRGKCLDIWAKIIYHYSRGKLTNSEDKLVAIAALAEDMKPLMQCRYLAGHWEIDLVKQLAWPGYGHFKRPSQWRAPSWSWASVDGPHGSFIEIHRDDGLSFDLADISKVEMDILGDDELGQIREGTLTVRGPLLRTLLVERVTNAMGFVVSVEGVYGNDLQFYPDDWHSSFVEPIYCVPMLLILGNKPMFGGLALQKHASPDVYRRVGSIELRGKEAGYFRYFRKDGIFDLLGKIQLNARGEEVFVRNDEKLQDFKIV